MKSCHLLGASVVGLCLTFALASEPEATVSPATMPVQTSAEVVEIVPALQPMPWASAGISDDQIGASIERASSFLLSNFDPKGTLKQVPGIANQVEQDGLQALCIYALLEAGQATNDPRLSLRDARMKVLVEQLKRAPLESDPNNPMPVTFGRSFRALALSVYNRPEDRETLKRDVDWLLQAHRGGAYTVDDVWPEEQRVAQTPHHDAGPAIIVNAPIVVAGGTNGKLGSHGTTSFQAKNYKQDNTYLNKQRDNTYLSHQPDNFYYNHEPDNFYFGRDMCIPAKGRIMISSNPAPPTTRPRLTQNNPSETSGVSLGVYQPSSSTTKPDDASSNPAIWDNSNSQLAAMAVYTAAQAGIDVPNNYWQAVDGHWVRCQYDDGEWGYSEYDPDPRVSMTCAGLASFLVTLDRLSVTRSPAELGDPADTPRMAKALAWLDQSDNSVNMLGPLTRYVSYNLFTLERVGMDGGWKYFGSHDWYRELAGRVIPVQWPNGAFGRNFEGYDSVVESAFTLLFLSRGRSPVFMEKLQFDGDWSNRPRDLANAARFASTALERPLNWEIVPLDRDWTDWLDSPLMFIASDQAPNFSDADIAKLRSYIQAGGMIFTHADGGSAKFNDYVEKTLAGKLFPQYPMQAVPADDPIYSTQYQLTGKDALPLRGIRNGSRWLLVHSSADLASSWQRREEKTSRPNFELATNLYVYAAGKGDLRNRVTTPLIAPPTTQPAGAHIHVALLTYKDGNCDPEPAAWPRLADWMQATTNRVVDVSLLPADGLSPVSADVAVLTGNAAVDPTDKQIAAIKAFVSTGGWLLVDDCGGSGEFAKCFESQWLPKLADQARLSAIPSADPLIHGDAARHLDDLSNPQYRQDTLAHVLEAANLQWATIGQGRIIFTPVDLTSGLLGANTSGIYGYAPSTAMSIAKNVLLAEQMK